MCIMMYTVNLEQYNIRSQIDFKLPQVITLSKFCWSTCSQLELYLAYREEGIFSIINCLSELMTLSIHLSDQSSAASMWAFAGQDHLLLPKLKKIIWYTEKRTPVTSDMLEYLALCCLAPNCAITLSLPSMRPEDTAILLPLFYRNQVDSLNLVKFNDPVQIALIPIMTAIRHVRITNSPPARALATGGTLPRHLRIDFPGKSSEEALFWSFLRDIPIQALRANTAYVQLEIRWKKAVFSWVAGDQDPAYAAFIGQLLSEAVRLYKKNVKVIDCHGLDYRTM
jgi:hypothetical protein